MTNKLTKQVEVQGMKKLDSLKGVQALKAQELKEIEGGIIPALVVWWAGASLLAKVGVIAGGTAVVGAAAAIGYYNGYHDTLK